MSTTASAGPSSIPVRGVLPSGLTKLLWELRDAYEASTGETVRVSRLLLDRSAFVEFLAEASHCSDDRVKDTIARIRAVAPELLLPSGQARAVSPLPVPAAAVEETGQPADRIVGAPSAAEIAAEHKALVERVQASAGDGTAAPTATPPTAGPPVSGPGSPSGGALFFDRARSIAGFVAAILLSLAAARYLVTDSSSAPPAPSTPAAPTATAAAPLEARAAASTTVAAASTAVAAPSAPVALAAAQPPTPATPATPEDPVAALFAAHADTLIRIHGSNTVGEKLSPNLVEAFLKSKGTAVVASRSRASAEEKELRARIPGQEGVVAVEVHAHGSTTAFTDLASATATVGQSSRRIKNEERDSLLAANGDLTTAGGEHVIALDGVAVIVHPSNAARPLSLAKLAKIFAGEVRDWSELGGRPGEIHLVARDDKSGTWDTFKSLVLAPAKKELPASAKRFESSGELVKAVGADPSAIGFVGLPYVREIVRPLALSADDDGLALLPTPFTVSTEDYPLSRRLYLYTPTTREDAWVAEFVEFAMSDAGQRVVADSGFVSQTPRSEKVRIESFQPPAYRKLAGEAERLSLNFRFESGRDELDNKAVRDLDRLVRWLDVDSSRQIVLLGFTDASGDKSRNTGLSLQRARRVERELQARGIRAADVRGLGQVLPVATNTTEDGRNRNRRVEVWVR